MLRRTGSALMTLGAIGLLALSTTAAVAAAQPAPRPAAAAGTATTTIAPPPAEYAPDDLAFFEPPDPIPAGEHGTLLRFQAVAGRATHVYRIMYLSTTVTGEPTVVTGLVSVPDTASPPFGGHPLLLYGHGTIGLADQCAPSRSFTNGPTSGLTPSDEFRSIHWKEPWAVVATDYEGLGGPGGHPYLVGVSGGRSMLDAALAAHQLPSLYASPATAIVGWSQGGHAALWASQLAAEWAPGLDIVGALIAAPAVEPGWFTHRGATDAAFGPQAVAILAGLAAAYPEVEAALPSVLTQAGLDLVAMMNEQCFNDGVPGYSAGVAVTGGLFRTDPTAVEPFASLLTASNAGSSAAPAPILLFHYAEDANVPFEQSDLAMQRLCAAGHLVELLPPASRSPDPNLAPFVHLHAWRDAQQQGIPWLTGLLDGTTTPISSC